MPSVTKLISDQVEAATVDASGLDPAAVHPLPSPAAPLSQSRTRRAGQRRRPRRALDAGDATYGAVFDFGILSATSPTGAMLSPRTPRVQRPAGPFYYLEVTATALARPSYRRFLHHPTEDRFTAGQFLAELARHGLDPADRWRTYVGSDYLAGVARKP